MTDGEFEKLLDDYDTAQRMLLAHETAESDYVRRDNARSALLAAFKAEAEDAWKYRELCK